MSEEQHQKILKELEAKWLNKQFIDCDGEVHIVHDIMVDYREDSQHMNRVCDSVVILVS